MYVYLKISVDVFNKKISDKNDVNFAEHFKQKVPLKTTWRVFGKGQPLAECSAKAVSLQDFWLAGWRPMLMSDLEERRNERASMLSACAPPQAFSAFINRCIYWQESDRLLVMI